MTKKMVQRIGPVPMACMLCGHPAKTDPVSMVVRGRRENVWLCEPHDEEVGPVKVKKMPLEAIEPGQIVMTQHKNDAMAVRRRIFGKIAARREIRMQEIHAGRATPYRTWSYDDFSRIELMEDEGGDE
jgi:hypothetical protein